jgi:hypothetical protein
MNTAPNPCSARLDFLMLGGLTRPFLLNDFADIFVKDLDRLTDFALAAKNQQTGRGVRTFL